MQCAIVDTAWGSFGFVTRGGRLVRTLMPRAKAAMRRVLRQEWPDAREDDGLLPRFQEQIAAYFAGESPRFSVQVDLADQTAFRREVLEACRRIPFGRTASYADLARSVGKPAASRAVGGAMANNPLPLVIPCHRVVRSDGSLGGFSSPRGLKDKKRLLRLEGALE